MPIYEIQTKEYECSWCGYKWINRFNGKDGPIPSNCAKCKRAKWDKGQVEFITPTENGLRRRMKGFNKTYYWGNFKHSTNIIFPNDLSDKFLAIKPRPTINEIRQVLYPLGFDTRKYEYYIPDPDKPGKLKYDSSLWITDQDNPGKMKYNHDNEYKKLLEQEAQKRIEIMVKIMNSRGVEYDPAPIIERQREEHLRKERDKKVERDKNLKDQKIPEWVNQARTERKAREDEARRKKSERVKQWWASRR